MASSVVHRKVILMEMCKIYDISQIVTPTNFTIFSQVQIISFSAMLMNAG